MNSSFESTYVRTETCCGSVRFLQMPDYEHFNLVSPDCVPKHVYEEQLELKNHLVDEIPLLVCWDRNKETQF